MKVIHEQKDIQKTTEEVQNKVFVCKKELVEVELTGDKKLKSIKLSDNISNEDKEILEDMILIAINEAMNQVDKEMNDKLGKYKNIPGLF